MWRRTLRFCHGALPMNPGWVCFARSLSDTDCDIELRSNSLALRICAGEFYRHAISTPAAEKDGERRRTPAPAVLPARQVGNLSHVRRVQRHSATHAKQPNTSGKKTPIHPWFRRIHPFVGGSGLQRRLISANVRPIGPTAATAGNAGCGVVPQQHARFGRRRTCTGPLSTG